MIIRHSKILFPERPCYVGPIALTQDERFLVAGIDDETVRVFSTSTGEQVHCLRGNQGSATHVLVTEDSRCIVSGDVEGIVTVWSIDDGSVIRRWGAHKDSIQSMVLAPGNRLVTGGTDKMVHVWYLDTGKLLYRMRGHTDMVQCVAVTPDGLFVVSCSSDRTVYFWSLVDGKEIRHMFGHRNTISSLVVTPDGLHAVSGDHNGVVIVWSIPDGKEVHRFRCGKNGVSELIVTADSQYIVVGDYDACVRVFSMSTGKRRVRSFSGGKYSAYGGVKLLCLSRDNDYIMGAFGDGSVFVTSLLNEGPSFLQSKLLVYRHRSNAGRSAEVKGHADMLLATRDGQRFITCGFDAIHVWYTDLYYAASELSDVQRLLIVATEMEGEEDDADDSGGGKDGIAEEGEGGGGAQSLVEMVTSAFLIEGAMVTMGVYR